MSSGLIAITGLTGFIGGYLSRRLELQGVEFKAISVRALGEEYVQAEIGKLKNEGVHSIVHLAWPASSTVDYKNSKENIEASILSIDLGRSCVEAGIRFFGLGSPAEFFPNKSQYARSKRDCRDGLQGLIDSGQVAWLRPHYVFDNQTWPQFIGDAAKGVQTRILDDSAKSFIHVEDVVGAIALAVSKGLTGEIDIMFKKKVRPSELLGALGYRCEVIDEIQHLDYSAHLKTDSLLANGWLPAKTEEVLRLH